MFYDAHGNPLIGNVFRNRDGVLKCVCNLCTFEGNCEELNSHMAGQHPAGTSVGQVQHAMTSSSSSTPNMPPSTASVAINIAPPAANYCTVCKKQLANKSSFAKHQFTKTHQAKMPTVRNSSYVPGKRTERAATLYDALNDSLQSVEVKPNILASHGKLALSNHQDDEAD